MRTDSLMRTVGRALMIVGLAALVALLAGCTLVRAAVGPKSHVRLVILGDSNSAPDFYTWTPEFGAAWPTRLQTALSRAYPGTTYELINKAVRGRTTADILHNLSGDCLTQSPDIVCIMASTNDAYGDNGWTNFVPYATTESNLRSIITQIRALPTGNPVAPHPLIVLMSPPPAMSFAVYRSKHPADYVGWRSYSRTVRDRDLVRSLAHEYQLPYVATWDKLAALGFDGTRPNHSHYIEDGIHLSDAGRQKLANWTMEAIMPRLSFWGSVSKLQ